MPGSVGELIEEARASKATELDLSNLFFWDVPATIGELTHLRSLSLSNTQISSLPSSLGRLRNLTALTVSHARLRTLPDTIGQMSSLRHLDVSENQLTELPESIGVLARLETLDASSNKLTELPSSMGGLSNLRRLNLASNRLSRLPESLGLLQALEQLFLHDNDPLGVPPEVLGPTTQQVTAQRASAATPADIVEYYLRLRSGSSPLNEAKIIFVGRGAVGKTSLVNRLIDDRFDQHEGKTDGIKITNWPIRLHARERITLHIWDFGGQEIMHATHQFFLTQRSIYLLVLNGREGGEDADAEYWLKLIDSFGDESPVLVVLNKIREHPFDLNRRALQQKYPAIREFVRTDCADGTGIAELRRAIERETDRLEHLRDPFPASWFRIKQRLSDTKRNYLTFNEYRDFCRKNGEQDKTAQGALAGYLHNLGIALNFSEDSRLRDTHVLNPHWVTNAIYKILNAPALEQQKGTLSLNDLANLLDEKEYPERMHYFIIDLMKKFDLCFAYPDDETLFLIPELLDKQEPEEARGFARQQCLNFEYHYTVLPEGLLPRLIVRTHTRSHGQPRWRTGVILEFEGCRALVRADIQDRKMFVSVTGPTASRRRLLAIVRSYAEEIHSRIPRLQPRAMVPVPGHPDVVVEYDKLLQMELEGIAAFPEYVSGGITQLKVDDLLNGVELDGPRRDRGAKPAVGAVRLFYSYSHKDESLRDELETHLKLLQRQGLVETWYDRKIDAGEEWRRQIDDRFERADIILLLVSADFIASDYCWDKEMTAAMKRHESGRARVVPVIVRDVNWTGAPFARLQALPDSGKAVDLWDHRDTAWRQVSEGIEGIISQIRAR